MAYVNVKEWSPDQVAEWLRGVSDAMHSYTHVFVLDGVSGSRLLNLTVDDLYKLHVEKVGHQELILEALEHLRNLHFHLDTETLQYVCLRLSCKARSLCNEIRMARRTQSESKQEVTTPTLSSVADVMDAVWTLISWLDHEPFSEQEFFHKFKLTLLPIAMELATNAHRDTFAEKPVDVIRESCEQLANLSDAVIQRVNEPLVFQSSRLDIANVASSGSDTEWEACGIVFDNNCGFGSHVVSHVQFGSPAHVCGRVQPGDEIVQVNYQTVIGWQRRKLLKLLSSSCSSLVLTLRKRPRDSSSAVFGGNQIYVKRFRVPLRQKEPTTSYLNDLASPRAELMVAPQIRLKQEAHSKTTETQTTLTTASSPTSDKFDFAVKAHESSSGESDLEANDDDDDDDDEAFLPTPSSTKKKAAISPSQSIRSGMTTRPRSATLQRRATISGSESGDYPRHYINLAEMWAYAKPSGESKNSTLRSKDSGLSTMSSQEEKSKKSARCTPISPNVFDVDSKTSYMNVEMTVAKKNGTFDKKESAESSLNDSTLSSSSMSPMRSVEGGRKRPIPQPRSHQKVAASSQSSVPLTTTRCSSSHDASRPSDALRSLRNLLPEVHTHRPVVVPNANFVSYRRVPQPPTTCSPSSTTATSMASTRSSATSLEYVNFNEGRRTPPPPALPARRTPSTASSSSLNSSSSSIPLFDLLHVSAPTTKPPPPPTLRKNSNVTSTPLRSVNTYQPPNLINDESRLSMRFAMNLNTNKSKEESAVSSSSSSFSTRPELESELPPLFQPSSYSFQELSKKKLPPKPNL